MSGGDQGSNGAAGALAVPFDLLERAARLGQLAWVERRVCELTGAWVLDTPDDAATVFLGASSRRHGRHADVLADCLPVLSSVDADSLERPPGPATEALFDSLRSGPAGTGAATAGRLVGIHGTVVPALVHEYRRIVAGGSVVAEPSLLGRLSTIIDDDDEEIARAAALCGPPESVAELRAALGPLIAATGELTC